MAFPGNPKMCFVITGCCIHNTSIKYKSYTGQFSAQTQHSNYCIFTLVNREKLFSGLNCKRMYTACGFFFCFVFFRKQENHMTPMPRHTHMAIHTHTNRGTNPSGLPACLLPLLCLIRRSFFICRTQRNDCGPM